MTVPTFKPEMLSQSGKKTSKEEKKLSLQYGVLIIISTVTESLKKQISSFYKSLPKFFTSVICKCPLCEKGKKYRKE